MRSNNLKRVTGRRQSFWFWVFIILVAAFALVQLASNEAFAQNASSNTDFAIDMEVGAGGNLAPAYDGSQSYLLTPYPIIRVHHLKLGELEFGGEKKYGFSFFPSFKVRGERSSSSFAELQGLPDVDRAIELGVGLQYEQADYRVFVEGRRGFSGHNGWNGEAGIDFKLATNTGWDFAVGPRISFADDRYSETYFSVETPTARLAAFDADSGIKSYGVAGSARYQITSQLAWENSLEYARLVGSAAKSPITQTRDQFTFRSGISYRFQIGY